MPSLFYDEMGKCWCFAMIIAPLANISSCPFQKGFKLVEYRLELILWKTSTMT